MKSSFAAALVVLLSGAAWGQSPPKPPLPDLAELLGIPGFAPPGAKRPATPGKRQLPTMPSVITAPVMTEAQREVMRLRQSTCFAPSIGKEAWGPRAAAAAVQIMAVTPEGNSVATGTVIRGSNQMEGGANAILTAMHVPELAVTGAPGTAIGILSSNGEPIGWAEVVAKGHVRSNDSETSSVSFKRGDIAVMRIRGFVRDGERIFRDIEGVDVRKSLNTHVMRGEVSNPAGTNPGISGAGAFDSNGNIYGVTIRRSAENNAVGNWSIRGVKQEANDPMVAPGRNGERTTRQIVLPQSSTTYVESLLHPEVLAALGSAASDILVQDGGSTSIATTIFGFPSGACIGYRGNFRPY